jgi:predicted polyphosphate/ATP-dependent NAD kinase
MAASAGIIANPASGKDIRRLVAHGSVFDNNEKVNIIRRILRALDDLGIERVLAMPDAFGLIGQAQERARTRTRVEFLDISVTNTAKDSTLAARMMADGGVGCIVTLGGDGTNRVVAKGCDHVPLVPVSTGTNNVFPVMVEGTLAGLAAGVVALRVEGVREAAIRMARRLEILQDGELTDIALVDVVVYDERFVGSRAIWDAGKIRTVVVAQARMGTIGASAIAGFLPEVASHLQCGVWLEVGPGNRDVRAPIAPGLLISVPVRSVRWMAIGDQGTVDSAPALLALDGEREIPVRAGEQIQVRLSRDGPHVVDIAAAVQAAVRAGVFVSQKSPLPGANCR